MFNPYQPHKAKILEVSRETEDVKRFVLNFQDKKTQAEFEFVPGQFIELSVSNFNEAPFVLCSSPKQKKYFEICVRKVGSLTSRLHEMKKNELVGVRGPYGNGFPMEKIQKRNTLIVAGGLGLVPFRPLIHLVCEDKKKFPKKLQLFYGSKAEKELLFKRSYSKWSRYIDFHITLDVGKSKKIAGLFCNIGLVTTLFDKIKVIPNSIALVCGPPIMCKFVIQKLKEHHFADCDIYLSLERRMECGIGVCEHCTVGPYYVCKDGPIFNWAQLKRIKGVI